MRPLSLSILCAAVIAACLCAGLYCEARAPRTKTQHCLATTFGPKPGGKVDRYAGQRLACDRTLIADSLGRVGIAHRFLPCFSKVRITHTKGGETRTVVAEVLDRGPYLAYPDGCDYRDREAWKACRVKLLEWREGMNYRACADLLHETADRLNHGGWGRVTLEYAWPPRKRPGT